MKLQNLIKINKSINSKTAYKYNKIIKLQIKIVKKTCNNRINNKNIYKNSN